LAEIEMANGDMLTVVAPPVQFDGEASTTFRAPEVGEHTEEVLLKAGFTWEQLSALKEAKAIQ